MLFKHVTKFYKGCETAKIQDLVQQRANWKKLRVHFAFIVVDHLMHEKMFNKFNHCVILEKKSIKVLLYH